MTRLTTATNKQTIFQFRFEWDSHQIYLIHNNNLEWAAHISCLWSDHIGLGNHLKFIEFKWKWLLFSFTIHNTVFQYSTIEIETHFLVFQVLSFLKISDFTSMCPFNVPFCGQNESEREWNGKKSGSNLNFRLR